nr:unnamed protein product [Digitaria exilis]
MALKCSVELHIPTAIHNLGGAASLPDLVTALSLPQSKLPFLRRLMRLLVTSGIFVADSNAEVETYRLNPLSWLLVEGVEAEDHTYQKYFVTATVSRHYLEAGLSLADWFKKDLHAPLPSPFEELHGVPLVHETTKLLDEELDRIVNKVRAILRAYPNIKCTVLDLPKVIENAPTHDLVNYVAGDMFHTISPAQAVMLKLVLHFWTDEDCVKILEQCRKAIPSREEGGKVIIIEIILGPSMGPIMYESQLLMDMLMMVITRGRQRDENDWREIFVKAGYSNYKIVKKIGTRGIIEVYP